MRVRAQKQMTKFVGGDRSHQERGIYSVVSVSLLYSVKENVPAFPVAVVPKKGHTENRIGGGLFPYHDVQHKVIRIRRVMAQRFLGRRFSWAIDPQHIDASLAEDSCCFLLTFDQNWLRDSGVIGY